jgi:hypothetical protein
MPSTQQFAYLFWISLAVTILLYVLRGMTIVTLLPGWVLLVAIFISIASGLTYGVLITKR